MSYTRLKRTILTFHPGRCAKVTVNGELIGYVGQLHPEAAANFGVNAEVYCATLSMEVMFNNAGGDVKYTALPKFPSTYRDLSLVCNEDVPSGDIVAVIEKTAKHLEAVRLFDMYKGEQVPCRYEEPFIQADTQKERRYADRR